MIRGLRSGQVAEAAGVNVQTLRYYERRGLLAEPRRTNGGHRVHGEEAVTALRVIKAAQRLGFTLEEVAELLAAGRHRHGRPSRDSKRVLRPSWPRSTRRSPTSPRFAPPSQRRSTRAARTWLSAPPAPAAPSPSPTSPGTTAMQATG
ncbi:MerR family transcriptional regulator [Streptomyces sp. NPDC048560]|uniref:MerR family transcriptional regulator n=1 Tax=Streptomyces sp. NPDC048560 TaxID=3155488 RepID=UPI0034243475